MKVEGRPFRSFDVFIFTICSTIGAGLALLPYVSGEEIRSAWLKISTSALPSFLLIYLIYLFSIKYPDWNFFSALKEKMWSPFYYATTGYIVVTLLFGWIVILRTSVIIIQAYLLANTPQWMIMLLLLGATLPAVIYGVKAIVRFIVAFTFVEIAILVVLLLVILTSDYFRWIYIPPVLIPDMMTYVKASVSDISRYVGIIALFSLLPYVKKNEPLIKPMSLGLLFVVVIYVLLSIAVIGTFGYEEALNLFSPIIALSHTFAAEFGVFERIDLFLLSFWIYVIYKMMIVHYWFLVFVTKQSLPKLKTNWIILVYAVIIYGLALYLPDYTHNMWAFYNHNALVGLIFVPIALLVFLLLRKRREGNVQKNLQG